MALPDAPTEDDTERDGFLSYAGEWHGLAIGAFFGLAFAATGRAELLLAFYGIIAGKEKRRNAHFRDAAKEVAYSTGAFVAAYYAQPMAATAVEIVTSAL